MSDYRIYVACLAAYNAGHLHGEWIDVNPSEGTDALYAEIRNVLSSSPQPDAEEWAIHDYELGGCRISEYESLENVIDTVELLEEHNDDTLVSGVMNYYCDLDEAKQALEERYQGKYDSLEQWAEEFLHDTGDFAKIPENLRFYFDYEKYARDCDMGGDITTIDTDDGVAVFWSH